MEISIHSPLAGRDVFRRAVRILRILFQSTRPSRGETRGLANAMAEQWDFNPLAPRGARLCRYSAMASSSRISIHSPLAGRDRKIPGTDRYLGISIHSPLAGRDADGVDVLPDAVRISIHSPLAGRDGRRISSHRTIKGFQSTRPSRGETPAPPMPAAPQTISIHSPLAGRDFNAREVDGQLVISIHSPLAGRDSQGPSGG